MDDTSAQIAAELLHGRGLDKVLITRGGAGVYASERDASGSISGKNYPAFEVIAKDTTAAGDVFNGCLAVALAEGKSLVDAIAFAQAGARFNARFELRTFQAAMELVERGLCYMICDPITSESYASYAPKQPRVKFLPFEPALPYPLALMTPAHRPLSELAIAFRELVATEICTIMKTR